MNLNELKQVVYADWEFILQTHRVLIQPDQFKREIRQRFGDLRRRSTWEQAMAYFYAQLIHDACLDAWSLILCSLDFTPDSRFYPYRHQILEAFLTFPDGLEMLKTGLEQIFKSNDFTAQEREEAQKNGFFAMVREQSTGGGLSRGAVELVGQCPKFGEPPTG